MPRAGNEISPAGPPLNMNQKAFCRAFARSQDGTKAYHEVYGTDIAPESAIAGAARLLADVRVKAEIDRRLEAKETRLEISADRVLLEVARLALLDPRRMVDDGGNFRQLHEMTADEAACIREIEFTSDGEKLKKVKFWDKNSALDKLGKYFKMFIERTEVSGPGGGAIEVEQRVAVMKKILAEIELTPHGLMGGVPTNAQAAFNAAQEQKQQIEGKPDV